MLSRFFLLATSASVAFSAPAIAQSSAERPTTPPAPAQNIDPVGTYELNGLVQGSTTITTLKIEKRPDATLGGTVATDAYGTFAIDAVKVSGNTMTITLTANGNSVTMTLTREGDQVSGDWSMSTDG